MSPLDAKLTSLISALGPRAGRLALEIALDDCSICELAAANYDWPLWAREKQIPPDTSWRSWGFLTGRGFGKTVAISYFLNQEVQAGRAMSIGLAAQKEEKAIEVQVKGLSGLIATAPPWFKPHFEETSKRLIWPNGAVAYVYTPEAPGAIRGGEFDHFWATEMQSWPPALREEAVLNIDYALRRSPARLLWDATPKRRHPILKQWLAQAEANPAKHVIVRGTMHENALSLSAGVVEELERRYGGTQKGREELLGEMLTDSESALFKQAWIDEQRRAMPSRLAYRIVSIDPAVSNRKGSDTTGIIEAGLGIDGQAFVLGDDSGKYDVGRWAEIALDRYMTHECDVIIAETNKGGTLVTQNLRSLAATRGLVVDVVEKDARPQRVPGKVFVKEVYARGAKEDRAEPVATAYERRRVSHVLGVDLSSLEDTLTTWEPTPSADSPGDLDALVHAIAELLKLSDNRPDGRSGFEGIDRAAKQVLDASPSTAVSLVFDDLYRGGGRNGRI